MPHNCPGMPPQRSQRRTHHGAVLSGEVGGTATRGPLRMVQATPIGALQTGHGTAV